MKIHNKLDEILDQGAKVKILRFLFNNGVQFTGRAIAKGAGLSASGSYEALQKMKAEGIVDAERQGNAILYSLYRDNYTVKNILKPLYEKEKGVYKEIVSVIKKVTLTQRKYITSIAIFGSVASKQDALTSDIDLLIVVKNPSGKTKVDKWTDNLSIIVGKKFSAAIAPYILTELELKKKYNQKSKLIKSIFDNNKLIYGEPIERIVA